MLHEQVYYEAIVRERKDNMIKVHFYRWPSKFDEWIDINSGRLAPYKSYTMPNKVRPLRTDRQAGR